MPMSHPLPLALVAGAALLAGGVAIAAPDGPASPAPALPGDGPATPRVAPPPTASPRVAPPDPDAATTQALRVPALRGLTVAEAAARLRRAGLRPEGGLLLVAPAGGGVLGRHRRGARRVTLQSPAAGSGASQGDVVAVATTPGLGRGATLEPLSWQAMRFARGRLTLGGLRSDPVGAPASCASADHAVVGGGGRQRTVRLWAVVSPDVRCLRASEAVLAPGRGWSRRTIAWSAPLDRPRPTLPRQRTTRIERGVLQPDRRHAVVSYWHGACDALASTSATLDGRRVRVTVRLGDTVPPETACAAIAVQGQALVTLPARAPRDAIFVAADGR